MSDTHLLAAAPADSPYQRTVLVPLRWGDMDAQQHVNNAMFADYLQEARAGFLHGGGAQHLLGGGMVVVSHQLEYTHPIVFSREPLEVRVGVTGVGAARVDMAYELYQFGVLCARATTRLCPYDFAGQRPRRLQPDERAWFQAQQVAVDPLREVPKRALHGRGHEYPVQVRWSDLDAYGHVNNVRYFDFVQEARIAMTTDVAPQTARLGKDSLWLVVRQDLDYLVQMNFRHEPFVVRSAPVAIGTSSATFAAEVVDPTRDQLVLARAVTVQVHADGKGVPKPIEDETRAAFEAIRSTGEPSR